MNGFTILPPLALYVHIPWCVRKCPYCDFNSHAMREEIPEGAYIDALLRDLEQDLPSVWGRVVSSIFIGGGTPSLLHPDQIARLIDGIRSRIRCAPGLETTLEANPGTFESGRFEGFRSAGVNRLSIGIQSFNDDQLRKIGRIHDGRQAIDAVEAAHGAGFDSFNLDLMFGLPEQSREQALDDVRTAIDLAPKHISHYELTLEPNTAFHHAPPSLPEDETVASMQEDCHDALATAGYENYEVSAFAIPGFESRHNLNYWQFGDYLAIGAGAHAKITDAQTQTIRRYSKQRHPQQYLDTAGTEACRLSRRELDTDDRVLEFMMNGLRLSEGIARPLFSERTGLPDTLIADTVQDAIHRGFLADDDERLRPTPKGRRFLNDLLAMF